MNNQKWRWQSSFTVLPTSFFFQSPFTETVGSFWAQKFVPIAVSSLSDRSWLRSPNESGRKRLGPLFGGLFQKNRRRASTSCCGEASVKLLIITKNTVDSNKIWNIGSINPEMEGEVKRESLHSSYLFGIERHFEYWTCAGSTIRLWLVWLLEQHWIEKTNAELIYHRNFKVSLQTWRHRNLIFWGHGHANPSPSSFYSRNIALFRRCELRALG